MPLSDPARVSLPPPIDRASPRADRSRCEAAGAAAASVVRLRARGLQKYDNLIVHYHGRGAPAGLAIGFGCSENGRTPLDARASRLPPARRAQSMVTRHGNIDSCWHPKYESKIRLVAKHLMFEVCFA